ncbi:MAG TPA: site-specific integrase [Flavipsychrobacter sp.]|nr:site-specific integrase [Flavipsychrobacter sp.]
MGVTLRSRKLKDGSKSYYLDIIHNGARWSENLELVGSRGNLQTIKDQAIEIRDVRATELAASNYDVVPVTAKKKSFITFWEDYLLDYDKGDRRSIVSSLGQFKKFCNGKDLLIGQINEQLCKNFKSYLLTCESSKGGPLKGETPANYFARFKKILKEANAQKLMKQEPAKHISLSLSECIATDPKQTLTRSEIYTLAKTECGNETIKKAFLFCCITGLRTSEARKFNPKDILYINVNGKWIAHMDIDQKKGTNPKPKLIPLNDFALILLGDFSQKLNEPFFQLPSQNGINKSIKVWLEKAGIRKHITFYCARHSCATILVSSKVDPRTVIGILGHSSFKYLARYAHEVDKNKVEALELLNLVDDERKKINELEVKLLNA